MSCHLVTPFLISTLVRSLTTTLNGHDSRPSRSQPRPHSLGQPSLTNSQPPPAHPDHPNPASQKSAHPRLPSQPRSTPNSISTFKTARNGPSRPATRYSRALVVGPSPTGWTCLQRARWPRGTHYAGSRAGSYRRADPSECAAPGKPARNASSPLSAAAVWRRAIAPKVEPLRRRRDPRRKARHGEQPSEGRSVDVPQRPSRRRRRPGHR